MSTTAPQLLGRLTRLSAVLVAVTFLDEFAASVPFVGAPWLQEGFGVSYGQATGWILAAGVAAGLVLEPPFFLLADRYPRKPLLLFALGACALACWVVAWAPSYPVFLAAISFEAAAVGWAVGTAQATLVDVNSEHREQVMLRWTLAAALGDLAGPVLVSAIAFLTLSWREAFVFLGASWAVGAVAVALQPFPEVATPAAASEKEPGLFESFRVALATPGLAPWIVAVLLCDLLDELLVGFAALYLRDSLSLDVHARGAVLFAAMVGAAIGLVAAGRVIARVRPVRLLLAASIVCAIGYVSFLTADTAWWAAASLFVASAAAAVHYPIAKAQAYRLMPGRSGALIAILSVASVVYIPIPLLLGWVADAVGLAFALALLGLQPVGLAAIAVWRLRRDPTA